MIRSNRALDARASARLSRCIPSDSPLSPTWSTRWKWFVISAYAYTAQSWLLATGAEPIQEEAAENIVEDRLPVVPAPDDVEVGTRLFVSRRPRHELKIAG